MLVAVFIVLSSVEPVYSAFSKDDAGTSGAQFLKLGAGGRASALGNSYVAISDDSTGIYWNPAGINQVKNVSVCVSHNIMFESIYYDWVSGVKKFGFGTVGIGVQYLSYGSIVETDDTGLELGNFKPNDIAISLSYGRIISDLLVGINAKYISSKLKDSATAFAGDIGCMYRFNEDKAALGLVVQNIGTKMKFEDEEEKLPMNIKLGGAYNIRKNWLAAVDINAPTDDEISFGAGTEYIYNLNNEINISGRAGYSTALKDTGGLNGITGGLGVEYSSYALDYAFVPFGDLGDTHRISLGLKF